MRQSAINQFQQLRDIIDTNIKTLEQLFKQSKTFSALILKMKEDSADEQNIENIEASHEEIDKSISDLLKQTKKLFDTYKALVENMFEK
jgi:hypothetical protein